MQGSPPSSDPHPRLVRAVSRLAFFTLLAGLSSCVTVSPAEKEFLAEPAMTFGSEGRTAAHADHVHANREGSYGARGVGGGGCGCN